MNDVVQNERSMKENPISTGERLDNMGQSRHDVM